MHFLCSSPSLHISSVFPLFWISHVGRVFLGFLFPFLSEPHLLNLFPFFLLQFIHQTMARIKTTSNPPPPKVNYRALYSWAPDELFDEYSSLTSTKAWRDHIGESNVYDHRAFAKRHDDDIAMLPCTLGEPVCGDERANSCMLL